MTPGLPKIDFMNLIHSIKGTRDLLPPETYLWQSVEEAVRSVFGTYNFGEIRTPIFEPTTLFARSVGEDTDIVSKEMYTWEDRDGDSLTLRPEATASVVRAYVEHSLFNQGGVHKLYYMGPMFRRERPQKGRYRQFYQIGAEVLGSDHPGVDAEVLEMLVEFLRRVDVGEFRLLINSVGCPRCRQDYLKVLRQALQSVRSQMCVDCQRRASTNPLRVLDCKVPADQPIIEGLPKIIDYLDPECQQHFASVTGMLKERDIEFELAPRLVRGLDYYTRTTFEFTSGALGAQNALLGGGRYDGLSQMIGGPPTPGFGFAIGEDRLVLAAAEQRGPNIETGNAGSSPRSNSEVRDAHVGKVDAYIAWLGDAALSAASKLARELRDDGFRVEITYEAAKLKKSMGVANRIGARFAVIIGEGELETGRYQVKDMAEARQEEVDAAQVAWYLNEKLREATGYSHPAIRG